jgi:SAM-dependent methyltransferase
VSTLRQALDGISGGRVLDVATGEGEFIRALMEHLESYVEIVGIDVYAYAKAAESVFCSERVCFCQMDATRMGFANCSFDTVSLSSALHHMQNLPRCVAEVKRVLKPGGTLIVRETHQDVRTEPQGMDMYIHHWAAEIDSKHGYTHNKTFTRQGIIDFVNGLGLRHVRFYDIPNTHLDPRDEAAIQDSEAAIDDYIRYAQDLADYCTLKTRGEALRRRLHQVGIQWEPELIAIGIKE